jgi:glycosyltransferase involved in cell wall biosynthesis
LTADPLRVMQVVGRFDGGGAERAARNLLLGLAAAGVPSVGLALREEGDRRIEGVEVLGLGAAGGPRGLARVPFGLRAALRSRAPRVIHVHGAGCLLPVAMLLAARRGRRPRLVFTWHDSGAVIEGPAWRRSLTRWALGRCDQVYGSSRDVVARLDLGARLVRPARVAPNGVQVRPGSACVGDEPPLLLWLGRLRPLKDPLALVEAAARLRCAGVELRLAFAGGAEPRHAWLSAQLTQRVRELGLEEITEIHGWVDPGPLLARAAIGVQTSRSEGLSLALLEQMMAGLGVVATAVGDTALACEDGLHGLLVPPGDASALEVALRRLCLDPSLRERLGVAARQRVQERYSSPAVAGWWAAEYAALIAG